MKIYVMAAQALNSLVQVLRGAGYQVIAPVLSEGAIIYDEIHSTDDLPQGWSDVQEKGYYRVTKRADQAFFGYAVGPHSWKKFLQLPRRQVWRAQHNGDGLHIEAVAEQPPALALLGVRSCELHAIAIQDRVFNAGPYANESYQTNESYKKRRDNIFTVALNCSSASATCFCTSMHTGPEVTLDCDLLMTEITGDAEHYFTLGSGSDRGAALLRQLPLQPATEQQLRRRDEVIQQTAAQVAQGPRAFDSSDLRELLYRNYESPAWEQVAERCLSCANCTMACPTCFCSTVTDTTDLSGNHAERWESWDSCFTGDFSHIHGGPVRATTRSRYRQWLTHKLATWFDQFGSSGCVGCGRCITWCPVGIDITEEVLHIREAEQREQHA